MGAPRMTSEQFWSRVRKQPGDGCWLIPLAAYDRDGYSRLGFRKRTVHRIAWELTHGSIPTGLWVLHKCDVPNCVRPDHLFLGTAKINTADMIAKGRARIHGAANSRAKLTTEQVVALRQRAAGGESLTVLAAEYSIDLSGLSRIVRGVSWRSVGGPRTALGRGHRSDLRKEVV